MSDENGKDDFRESVDKLLDSLRARRERLLGDMSPGYPAIRKFLLGCEIAGRIYPAGKILIETDAAECIVRLEIPLLDLFAEYTGSSSNDLLERIENDLDTETVSWRQGWKSKKRIRERAERRIMGS